MRHLGDQGEPEGDRAGAASPGRSWAGWTACGRRSTAAASSARTARRRRARRTAGSSATRSCRRSWAGRSRRSSAGSRRRWPRCPRSARSPGSAWSERSGVAVANQIPAVHAQFAKLGTQVMGTLETAVKPMIPFIDVGGDADRRLHEVDRAGAVGAVQGRRPDDAAAGVGPRGPRRGAAAGAVGDPEGGDARRDRVRVSAGHAREGPGGPVLVDGPGRRGVGRGDEGAVRRRGRPAAGDREAGGGHGHRAGADAGPGRRAR